MTEYCQQCSELLTDADEWQLVNLSERHRSVAKSGYLVDCAGCGITIVDENAKCIFQFCTKQHGEPI